MDTDTVFINCNNTIFVELYYDATMLLRITFFLNFTAIQQKPAIAMALAMMETT